MIGNVTVEVAASKVALPAGATETPSDFRADAVPASRATDVPTPLRLGIAVTVSAVVVPQLCAADNFRLTDASAKPIPPPRLVPIEAPSDHDELVALLTLDNR